MIPDSHFNRLVERLLVDADSRGRRRARRARRDGAEIGRLDLAFVPSSSGSSSTAAGTT